MRIDLIPQKGKFYKVNLHAHTNISDGHQTPEEVKEHYMSLGYSAVCYTDHEVLIGHEDLCDENFVALHGYEVAIKKDIHHGTGLFMPVYHFNLIAESQSARKMPRFFKNNPSMPGNAREWAEKYGVYDENEIIDETVYDKEWISDYLCAVRDAGFLVTYNHPMWSLQSYNDYIGLRGLHAVEAINGGCAPLNDNTSIHYEAILRSGMNVVPVGGDDNHEKNGCGLAWTMIKAEELTYDALIKAYKNGDCYASDGPEIHELYIDNGKLYIKCSPAYSIMMFSEGRRVGWKIDKECTMTEKVYALNPEVQGRYIRVEITDSFGHKAFSNAYALTPELVASSMDEPAETETK